MRYALIVRLGVVPTVGMSIAGLGASAAAATAQATGHPVAIAGLTTPASTVTVAPDGVRRLTVHVLPVRVRQHGRWVPASTRLRPGKDGLLAPIAMPGGTRVFSGGRAEPLATGLWVLEPDRSMLFHVMLRRS